MSLVSINFETLQFIFEKVGTSLYNCNSRDKLTRQKYFLQYFERCEDCFQFLHIHPFSPKIHKLFTVYSRQKKTYENCFTGGDRR